MLDKILFAFVVDGKEAFLILMGMYLVLFALVVEKQFACMAMEGIVVDTSDDVEGDEEALDYSMEGDSGLLNFASDTLANILLVFVSQKNTWLDR